MENLKSLSRHRTRLWIINALRYENAGAKINTRYKMPELIYPLETRHPRNRIVNLMMSVTNGDLEAACNLEDHIAKLMAVGFSMTLLRRNNGRKVESGGFMDSFYHVQHSGRDSYGYFRKPRASLMARMEIQASTLGIKFSRHLFGVILFRISEGRSAFC